MRDVELRSGERRLAARLFLPPTSTGPAPGLLFLHGLDSDQSGYEPRAELASAALGAVCMSFDLGGHGRSAGRRDELSPRDHLADACAAYDPLAAEEAVDPARIGVCGASYGGYLAALMLSRRPVRRLLLRAPALYDDEFFDVPLARCRSSRAQPDAPSLATILGDFEHDVLVLESESDEVIPPGVAQWYLAACRAAWRQVIPGAGHALVTPAERAAFIDAIVGFFDGM